MGVRANLANQKGLVYCRYSRFHDAITQFTKAIDYCPDVAIYWANRAQSHTELMDWTKAGEDCDQAITLDPNCCKGRYVLGLVLLQRQRYAQANLEFRKASTLAENLEAKEKTDMKKVISSAPYLYWKQSSEKHSMEQEIFRLSCESAFRMLFHDDETSLSSHLEELDEMFKKVAEDDKPGEVPKYLCCGITFDIMRNPVITPDGISYERSAIEEHLIRNEWDPSTRNTLRESQLVNNFALKDAAEDFLRKHGWAYKSD